MKEPHAPSAKVEQDTDVLLVIDVQRDFCPGGQLAIQEGDAVVPVINRLAAYFDHILLTQDWHPASHTSFASNHPGAEPYQTIQAPYGPQTLWPDHCVQGSHGAEFHPDLDLSAAELILRKGFRPEIDSYSAFLENDKKTTTGLAGYLRERGLTRLFFTGVAYDFCVGFSAITAAKLGFETFVIEDLTKAVGLPGTVVQTNIRFHQAGVVNMASTGVEGDAL